MPTRKPKHKGIVPAPFAAQQTSLPSKAILDGSVLDEEAILADLPVGRKKAEAFIVEISQLGISK